MIIRICKSCGEITEFESQEISKKTVTSRAGIAKPVVLIMNCLRHLKRWRMKVRKFKTHWEYYCLCGKKIRLEFQGDEPERLIKCFDCQEVIK